MNVKLLIARIDRAFSGVQRGEGLTLAEARVLETCGSDAARKKARSLASDQKWQDIPDAELEQHGDALRLLDPKGFHYYLPAYMRWSLQHLDTSKPQLLNAAIYALSPSLDQEVVQRNLERWTLFTAEERYVISKYLRLMVGQYDGAVDTFLARRALDAHWKQFNQKPVSAKPRRVETAPTT